MNNLPIQAISLINALKNTSEKKYKLNWKGSKIPRGAKVGNSFIDWTQNGIVSAGGKNVGFYERTIEWGGANKDAHEMIIYSNEVVYDTNGNECPIQD